ncbi:MAG: CcdB family protein [Sphingomonadales bacterium]|nr:CcdB family protein [Sphingomonadales bacterium]
MAQFDVYRTAHNQTVIDCQADLLSHVQSRFVVPLIEPESGLQIVHRLNPAFEIDGQQLIFFTQYATTMPVSELGRRICSLSDEHYRIMAALDMLISGI